MQDVSRGRELAEAMIARVQPRAALVKRKLGRPATLAILAGSDDASRRFVQIKRDMVGTLDLQIDAIWLEDEASSDDVVQIIDRLNSDKHVDAIFLQFPLPPRIDPQVAANAVAVEKDIDCSSDVAEARFLEGESEFAPVAPMSALDLLHAELGSLTGKDIAVFGEDAFARALKALVARAGANLREMTGRLDALVIGDAMPNSGAFEGIESISVLLDAGYYLKPRRAQLALLENKVRTFLTQYGNVGPLTVAHLAEALFKTQRLSGLRP